MVQNKNCKFCGEDFFRSSGKTKEWVNKVFCSKACFKKSEISKYNYLVPYYNEGMSIPEISDKTGVSKSTVRIKLKLCGCELRSKKESVSLALGKGRRPSRKGIKRPPFTEEHKKRISIKRMEYADKYAKNYSISTQGYARFTRGDLKNKMIHVHVMETRIGRKIRKGECVHHIDHDKLNNDISNLKLMSVSDHLSYHAKINHVNRKRNKKGEFL